MIRSKTALVALTIVFFVIEASLGVLLQAAQSHIAINLRYTAIIMAVVFGIVLAEKSLSCLLTEIALVATLAADYFLVYLSEMKQLPAMLFFSVVHITYFLRLYHEDKKPSRRITRLALHPSLSLAMLGVTLAVLGENADALSLVSMFCYINLILNTVFAMITFRQNSLLAIGLLLFLLCDTVIGLIFLKAYLPISPESLIYTVLYPGFDLAWAFYLPAQTLLAISLLPKRLGKRKIEWTSSPAA